MEFVEGEADATADVDRRELVVPDEFVEGGAADRQHPRRLGHGDEEWGNRGLVDVEAAGRSRLGRV